MGIRIGINRVGGICQNPNKRMVCDLVYFYMEKFVAQITSLE